MLKKLWRNTMLLLLIRFVGLHRPLIGLIYTDFFPVHTKKISVNQPNQLNQWSMASYKKHFTHMKPKIAFFITRLIIGGAEKDLRLLIEAMKDRYEIYLILTIRHGDMPPLEGVTVFYLTESESKSAFVTLSR